MLKRVFIIVIILEVAYLLGCSDKGTGKGTFSSSSGGQAITSQDFLDETGVVAAGSVVDLSSDPNIEEVEPIAAVFIHCGMDAGDMECSSETEDISSEEMEIKNGKLFIKKEGEYLLRVKEMGKEERVIKLSVGDPKKEAVSFPAFQHVKLHSFHSLKEGDDPKIYYFRLTPVFEKLEEFFKAFPMLSVKWEVKAEKGGQFKILDEDFYVLNKIRHFQKSIYFKDLDQYTITATLLLSDGRSVSDSVVVTVSEEGGVDVGEGISAAIRLSSTSAGYEIDQKISLNADVTSLEGLALDPAKLSYRWSVKRTKMWSCPSMVMRWQKMPSDQSSNSDSNRMSKVCGAEHETDAKEHQDYEFTKDATAKESEIQFKKGGNYEIQLLASYPASTDEQYTSTARERIYIRYADVVPTPIDPQKYRLRTWIEDVEEKEGGKLLAQVRGQIEMVRRFYMTGSGASGGGMPNFRLEWAFEDSDVVIENTQEMISVTFPKEGQYKAKVSAYAKNHVCNPSTTRSSTVVNPDEEVLLFKDKEVTLDIQKTTYTLNISVAHAGVTNNELVGELYAQLSRSNDTCSMMIYRKAGASHNQMSGSSCCGGGHMSQGGYTFEWTFQDVRVREGDYGKFIFPQEGSYEVLVKVYRWKAADKILMMEKTETVVVIKTM